MIAATKRLGDLLATKSGSCNHVISNVTFKFSYGDARKRHEKDMGRIRRTYSLLLAALLTCVLHCRQAASHDVIACTYQG